MRCYTRESKKLILGTITAFDFVSKKSGHKFDESTSEKITDGARSAYEKATGYVSL